MLFPTSKKCGAQTGFLYFGGSHRVLLHFNRGIISSVFLGGSDGKESAAIQETWVRSLGWEDPLEKRMVTHSSILAWRIPWTEEPGGLHSMGSQRVRQN